MTTYLEMIDAVNDATTGLMSYAEAPLSGWIDCAKQTEPLADALPKEMARVRDVLGHYREIGPPGMFGAAMIEQDLRAADRALMSGDMVAVLRSLKTLQGITVGIGDA